MKITTDKESKSVKGVYIAHILQQAFAFLSSIFLPKFLGTISYANYQGVLAKIRFYLVFNFSGYNKVFLRKTSRNNSSESLYNEMNTFISLRIISVFLVLLMAIVFENKSPHALIVLSVLFIAIIESEINDITLLWSQRSSNYSYVNKATIISSISSSLLIIVLSYFEVEWYYLVFVFFAIALIASFVAFKKQVYNLLRDTYKWSINSIGELISKATLYSGVKIIDGVHTRMDLILANSGLGISQFAIFAVSFQLRRRLLSFQKPINTVLMPSVIKSYSNNENISGIYITALKYFVFGLILVILSLFPVYCIFSYLGSDYSGGFVLFMEYCISVPFYFAYPSLFALMVSQDRDRFLVILGLLKVLLKYLLIEFLPDLDWCNNIILADLVSLVVVLLIMLIVIHEDTYINRT
jgi:O-antigen/teichoic acid export membrane protein